MPPDISEPGGQVDSGPVLRPNPPRDARGRFVPIPGSNNKTRRKHRAVLPQTPDFVRNVPMPARLTSEGLLRRRPVYSVWDVMYLLGRSKRYVYHLIQTRQLAAYRLAASASGRPREWRIRAGALEKFLWSSHQYMRAASRLEPEEPAPARSDADANGLDALAAASIVAFLMTTGGAIGNRRGRAPRGGQAGPAQDQAGGLPIGNIPATESRGRPG
jgi:hypothetical protein